MILWIWNGAENRTLMIGRKGPGSSSTLLCLHHLLYFTLYNLCVICSLIQFNSCIFELCILIVHTLKMCTDDAGPEQSLVLFIELTAENLLIGF